MGLVRRGTKQERRGRAGDCAHPGSGGTSGRIGAAEWRADPSQKGRIFAASRGTEPSFQGFFFGGESTVYPLSKMGRGCRPSPSPLSSPDVQFAPIKTSAPLHQHRQACRRPSLPYQLNVAARFPRLPTKTGRFGSHCCKHLLSPTKSPARQPPQHAWWRGGKIGGGAVQEGREGGGKHKGESRALQNP